MVDISTLFIRYTVLVGVIIAFSLYWLVNKKT